MRSILAVTLLAIICSFVCIAAETIDADTTSVMLFEINPYNDDEGISLHNYSSSDIDLKDYLLSDNPKRGSSEGQISFSDSLIIKPGETITFVKTATESSDFAYRHLTYTNGESGVSFSNNFNLNEKGDDVYLFKIKNNADYELLDVFIYGSAKVPTDSKWVGDTFKTQEGSFAVKKSTDGFKASCWYNYLIGGTNILFDPDLSFDAMVTPFLFPESGGIPIYDALEKAQRSVYINLYSLSSPNVMGLLKELLDKGIQVNLLLEGAPLDLQKPKTDGRLKTLSDAGATIMLIGDVTGDRFLYNHAKYCIIDDTTVIITSENWTKNNLNGITVTDPTKGAGNRGWGAIIESHEYAEYMLNVFHNDSKTDYGDVSDFSELTPGLKPETVTYTSPTAVYPTNTYNTTITPGLSPDNSFDTEIYYITKATDRICSEQQSLTKSFVNYGEKSPLKYLSQKASIGVDVKFIVSSNVNSSIVDEINATSKIKTAQMSDPYVHNKGLICDDEVIVASVNWTEESFYKDRESLVVIHSKDVANYYAEAFENDFKRNYKGDGLNVSFTEIQSHYDKPGEYSIGVTVQQTGDFEYTWNLDGLTKTTTTSRTPFNLEKGDHTLTVSVVDKEGKTGGDVATFTVGSGDSPEDSIFDKIKPYLAPIAIVLLAIIAAVFKLSMGNNKKKKSSKGKKGKKR